MSHIDTWDPKPDAASEHRSPFKPISTNVPGIHVTELLKQTAKHMDKLTLIRCMTQPTPGTAVRSQKSNRPFLGRFSEIVFHQSSEPASTFDISFRH
jgi:hypothetical protein